MTLSSGTLTLAGDVAVGTSPGANANPGIIYITGSGKLVSEGSPLQHNELVRYNTVQEGSPTASLNNGPLMVVDSNATTPEIRCRFTDWSGLSGSGDHLTIYNVHRPFSFKDGQFAGSKFYLKGTPVELMNCLWERVSVTLNDDGEVVDRFIYNNLFKGGSLTLVRNGTGVCQVRDTLFDETTISQTGTLTHDHNGYRTTAQMSGSTSGNVTISTADYLTGTLGNYYYPTTANGQNLATLINAGSRIAPDACLFHYTTKITQAKEGFSTVDIGLHYVALDANGSPADANTDGAADYLADSNGNGVVNSGETPWFNIVGSWTTPFNFGYLNENFHIFAIHASLLPSGKVLSYQHHAPGLFDPAVYDANPNWDPNNSWTTQAKHASFHAFCTGHTLMSDGTLFVAGGHIGTPAGLRSVAVYSPNDDFWTRLPRMDEGRWYPTCTTLDSGEVLITTGSYATGNPQFPIDNNRIPQVWSPATGQFRNLAAATRNVALYPFVFTAPDGGVFHAGPSLGQVFYTGVQTPDSGETVRTTRKLATAGTGAWGAMYEPNSTHEPFASAVMYQPGKVLLTGGISPIGGRHVINDAEVIDLTVTAGTPVWATVNPVTYDGAPVPDAARPARHQHNSTLLADGTVLVTGGHNSAEISPRPTCNTRVSPFNVRTPELWAPNPQNPAQWIWTTLAECPGYRGYHSIALLLPDGRVLSAGGDWVYPFYAPPDCVHSNPYFADAEIFSPPYLFKGSRPAINNVLFNGISSSTLTHGQPFTIQTPVADEILSVTLLRLGSVTHSFNMNQRFLSLR